MPGLNFQNPPNTVPIIPIRADDLPSWCARATDIARSWVSSAGFEAKPGQHCLLPSADGALEAVLLGIDAPERYALAPLVGVVPAGNYAVDARWSVEEHERTALGWALACYRFDRYKKYATPLPALCVTSACDRGRLEAAVRAHCQVRDLINTPTEDLGPAELADAVFELGEEFGASVKQIVGPELLEGGYRAIHAVGRASHRDPRLVDLQWGDAAAPRLTLVGKGVCFDTGGLDLKPANGMRLMKKDMGGAAHAIGLARMVMAARLPVRLHLLVAAVENAVSGDAYRPGDIITAKNGMTIEIDNTDAEGRVILSDALVEAGEHDPDLVMDFATLTGAARVALGPDVPAMFCSSDSTAQGISAAAARTGDPLWRLPLHQPYRKMIDSPFADIVNSAASPLGGAIIAALFLQDFLPKDTDWVHFDLMAWNSSSRPGRPEGGEAMGLHALFDYLRGRYGS